MPTTDKPANYVKLVAFGPPEISDAEAVSLSPHARRKTCAVSWVYPFTGKVEGVQALDRAQRKRAALREAFPDLTEGAFQLSTFKTSPLRGVPVVGVSIRPYFGAEAAE
jgi:hypothetical protein